MRARPRAISKGSDAPADEGSGFLADADGALRGCFRGVFDAIRGAMLPPASRVSCRPMSTVSRRSRRMFLSSVPLGAIGMIAACNDRRDAASSTSVTMPGGATPTAARPAPLLDRAQIPANAPVLTWTPRHEDLVYTFGGAAPKHHIAPGTRIVSWTEDCFDGAVKTSNDLASKVMTPGHDNPQTGPFYIDGAE